MRRLLRVCTRAQAGGTNFALVGILVPAWLLPYLDAAFVVGSGFSVRPASHLLHYWGLLVLGASFGAWTWLRLRGQVDPAAGAGFLLSAFGLAASFACHWYLYGMSPTYGSNSVIEQIADDRLRLLIEFHRYGGPLAYATGLLCVAWGSLPPRYPRPG